MSHGRFSEIHLRADYEGAFGFGVVPGQRAVAVETVLQLGRDVRGQLRIPVRTEPFDGRSSDEQDRSAGAAGGSFTLRLGHRYR